MANNPRVPEAKHPFNHSIDVQLRFNDVDMFGHVNNTVYLQFFDLGKMMYFNAVLGDDFMKKGLYVVIANINCNFYSPTYLEEPLLVLSTIDHWGEKSLILSQRIINKNTGDVKCDASTVMVGFDPKTLKSAELPKDIRESFVNFEQRDFD